MSTSLWTALPAPLGVVVTDSEVSRLAREMAEQLERWTVLEFTVIDPESGKVLYCPPGQSPLARAAFDVTAYQEIAARHRPCVLLDRNPLHAYALPLEVEGFHWVGVTAFLSRPAVAALDVECVAGCLDLATQRAQAWAARQQPRSREMVERLGALALDRLADRRRIAQLESEVERVSGQLGTAYEEITLINRLTQSLKLSSEEGEIAELTLDWLIDTVAAQGFAIQLNSGCATPEGQGSEVPRFLTRGACPLDAVGFGRLIEYLPQNAGRGPVVLNPPATLEQSWPFPGIQQLTLVPIGEGEQQTGWLAAFNQSKGKEFGSGEADLLSSIGAILGIHRGNLKLYREQAELLSGIVRALTSAIDAKDPYTCGHSDRVARVSARLAAELGYPPEEVEAIYLSGLLHDIGKIGVNDEVLRKPGKLTQAEFEHIKMHATIGYNILMDLKQLSHVLPVVLHHHESWDGSGYPHGLAAEGIPELARIVAVADAFDAMGSDRPYRKGMPDEKLDAVIRSGSGTQWDPRVVAAFFRARDDIRAMTRRTEEQLLIEEAEFH